MKIIVQTTGPHLYMDPQTRNEIPYNRPAVVQSSEFISTLVSRDLLKVLSNTLSDGATDAEFQEHLAGTEGDSELAIAAFATTYALPLEAEAEAEAEPKATKAPTNKQAKAK